MTDEILIARSQRLIKRLRKLRQDPRYLKVMGRLKAAGLLDVRDVPTYRGQVFLEDALWAAEIEPRIFELLPAIVARRPRFFAFINLPGDLDQVVREIRAGHPQTPYQQVEPSKYGRWVSFVGKRASLPKVMKTFRLAHEDLDLLNEVAKKTAMTQAQVLRLALRSYAKTLP